MRRRPLPAARAKPAKLRPLRASHSVYALGAPGLWRYWRFGKDVFAEAAADDLPMMAAALAHYALLSVVPILLITFYGLGMVLKAESAQQRAIELVRPWLPAPTDDSVDGDPSSSRAQRVEGLVTGAFNAMVKDRGRVGGVGLLAMLWICLRIFTTLQRALDRIWAIEPHEKRPLYWLYPVALGSMAFLGLFAWLSMLVSSFVASLRFNWPQLLYGQEFRLPSLVTVCSVLASIVLSVLLIYLIYRWLPSARVRARSAAYGAVVAGTLWEVSKHVFAWFITEKANFRQFYGTMGGVVIVMIWCYLSAYILLLGAEVVYCHAKWIAATPVLEGEPVAVPAAEPAEPEPTPRPRRCADEEPA